MTGSTEFTCPDPSMRVLVANRGEIARRVFRSCADWGVASIAVYADPDADAPFVADATRSERIGPAALDESYLSIDAILGAAERSGATHVHPGYGFLSEQAKFAHAVRDAGLVWIGPSPDVIEAMGSKIEARRVAQRAGVPVIPGFNDTQDDAELAAAADRIGYPVLVKASAGGGGKGIRIADGPDDFDRALADARAEARRAFGDDDVIVERYITRPRHVEVQVAGDEHGRVIDLGTRECSVQRRYQKVLEEAPAPRLPTEVARAIRAAAVSLAEAIGYDSIGTVEFVVDADTDDFFFLEMNTRIQVEHTVTEQITGIDLVQLQLLLASGADMPVAADTFDTAQQTRARHSIEVRINAEDPWRGHVPQTGTVTTLSIPVADDVRWDAAIESGSEISPHYDSMIGKLIVTGDDRLACLIRLGEVLDHTVIDGVVTNVAFHRWLVDQADVRLAAVTTRFLDDTPLPPAEPRATSSPWRTGAARRLVPHRSALAFDAPSRDGRWHEAAESHSSSDPISAPFPGLVTEVHVVPGDEVEPEQPLLTIEAMKMLHPVVARGHATVAGVEVAAGAQVETGQTLITFVPTPHPDPGED